MSEKNYQKYIGDGVYVSYDGYHVNIAVDHHENHVVALDPDVVANLISYFHHINELNLNLNKNERDN